MLGFSCNEASEYGPADNLKLLYRRPITNVEQIPFDAPLRRARTTDPAAQNGVPR